MIFILWLAMVFAPWSAVGVQHHDDTMADSRPCGRLPAVVWPVVIAPAAPDSRLSSQTLLHHHLGRYFAGRTGRAEDVPDRTEVLLELVYEGDRRLCQFETDGRA